MKSRMRTNCAAWLLALVILVLNAAPSRATVVDDRINHCLDAYIASHWPPLTNTTPMQWIESRVGYAMAVFKRQDAAHLATAQQYIDDVCNCQWMNPVPSTGTDGEGFV